MQYLKVFIHHIIMVEKRIILIQYSNLKK